METSVWKLSFALQSRASKSIIVFYRSKRVVKDNREYYLTDFQLFFSVLNTVYRIFWPSLCLCVCECKSSLFLCRTSSARELALFARSLYLSPFCCLWSFVKLAVSFVCFVCVLSVYVYVEKTKKKPFATSVAKIFAQATVGNSSRINKSAHLLLLIKTFMGTHTQMSCTHTHTLKTRTHTLTNFLINMSKADAGGPTTTTAVTAPLQCCKCKQNTTKC